MPDGIRSIDSEGLIPLPREILRAKRRRSKSDSQAEQEFEQILESDEAHPPRAPRPKDADHDYAHGYTHRPDRKHEGLGGDLDLLA